MSSILDNILAGLRQATQGMTQPAGILLMQRYGQDPFIALVGCVLSLRTKDAVSLAASLRLFEAAKTPEDILRLPGAQLQKLIYPVGFYRRKAASIHALCALLVERYEGKVPATLEGLTSLPGVGRKTANLVLAEGFGIPALCVDTHVHRISNRLGLVNTKTPEETERALRELLPAHSWIEYSRLLVTWGQNVCVPVSPKCSRCPVAMLCKRVGVTQHR